MARKPQKPQHDPQTVLAALMKGQAQQQRITYGKRELKSYGWSELPAAEILKRTKKGNVLTLDTEAGTIRITYELVPA